jgi:cytochrome c oxidase subunit III
MAMSDDIRYDRDLTLTRDAEIALKNKRTGINIFQVSWIMVFISLVIVNWQLRYTATTWPPPGVEPLNAFLPTLATIGLLASMFTVRRANRAMSQDDRRGFTALWRVTLILGLIFVSVMAFEWLTLPPVPETTYETATGELITGAATQFNAVFRLMTAFHAIHAVAIGLYMLWVMRRASAGTYSSRDYWDIEAGMKLWLFVVLAWLMFYVVLYWI